MEPEGSPERPHFLSELDYLRAWAELCFFSLTGSWFLSPPIQRAVRSLLIDLAFPMSTVAQAGRFTGVTLSAIYECVFFLTILPLMFTRKGARAERTELLKTFALVFATAFSCMWFVSPLIVDLAQGILQISESPAVLVQRRIVYLGFGLSVAYFYAALRFFVSRMHVRRTLAAVEEEAHYADIL